MYSHGSITFIFILLLIKNLFHCQAHTANNMHEPNFRDQEISQFKYTAYKDRSIQLHFGNKKQFLTHDVINWPHKENGPPNMKINISYYPIFEEGVRSKLVCNNGHMYQSFVSTYEENSEYCREKLSRFSLYNETSQSEDPLNLLRYCETRYKLITSNDLDDNGSIFVYDLLPSQIYRFRSEITVGDSTIEPGTLDVCTKSSPPMFPPHSDYGSFHVLSEDYIDDSHGHQGTLQKVRLFWRPVPDILAGSHDTSYHIVCSTFKTGRWIVNSPADSNQGYYDFIKPSSEMYSCKLVAENDLGTSNYTYINVPNTKHLLKFRKDFKFHVANIAENQFNISWEPVNSNQNYNRSLHRRVDANHNLKIQNGYYTIYWCYENIVGECKSLAGFVRADGVSYTLNLPKTFGDKSGKPIRFGLSYWHESDRVATGIIWSNCVSQMKSVHIPVELNRASQSSNAHRSIKILWNFQHCGAMSAVISKYQITYCPISTLTDCSMLYSTPSDDIYLRYMDNHDPEILKKIFEDESCKTLTVQHQLESETFIEDLDPGTGYMIRARYSLFNGTSNPWSEPLFAHTSIDPLKKDECWKSFSIIVFIVVLGGFMAGLFVYPKSKKQINHYYLLLFRFKKTRSAVTKLFDHTQNREDFGEVALKYRINRTANRAKYDDSGALLDNIVDRDSDKFLQALFSNSDIDYNNNITSITPSTDSREIDFDQTLDYVPSHILRGFNESNLSRPTTDSDREVSQQQRVLEPDEISFTSHSSFLERILSPEPEEAQENEDKE